MFPRAAGSFGRGDHEHRPADDPRAPPADPHLVSAAFGTAAAVALQTTTPLMVGAAEAAGRSPWPALACTAVATAGAVAVWLQYLRAYVDYRVAGPGWGGPGGP